MVVLASSVCTKSGKAVISRQFVEMSRPRIEGLLASFPKLISAGGQHTYVETEAVRYIYQPLEDLYLVLITNKQSNILQDINTLHLFARTVSEYCRTLKEHEIARNAYELICAFDEIVTLGMADCMNIGQIRTYTEMDSQEEKLQEMLQKSKEREALEKAKLKAKQLEMQKREMQKRGLSNSGFGGSGMGSNNMGRSSFPSSTMSSPPSSVQNSFPTEQSSGGFKPTSTSAPSKKGMQLGASKPSKTSGMLEAIRADEGIPDSHLEQAPNHPATGVMPTNSGPVTTTSSVVTSPQGPVHLILDEKISASLNRDGGLENMEVKGELILRVSAADKARLKVAMKVLDMDSAIQFKTHPHVDKNLWQSEWAIATKDSTKPFPLNQPTPVVKWRYVSKDESMVPLAVNVWPAPNTTGSIDCSVEYELMSDKNELRDVCIIIPLPSSSGQPKIDHVDGNYRFNASHKTLEWLIPLVDSSNTSGTLEFTIPGAESNDFFPVKVNFNSKKTFCNIEIANVISLENNSSIEYTADSMCCTDEYQIV